MLSISHLLWADEWLSSWLYSTLGQASNHNHPGNLKGTLRQNYEIIQNWVRSFSHLCHWDENVLIQYGGMFALQEKLASG